MFKKIKNKNNFIFSKIKNQFFKHIDKEEKDKLSYENSSFVK